MDRTNEGNRLPSRSLPNAQNVVGGPGIEVPLAAGLAYFGAYIPDDSTGLETDRDALDLDASRATHDASRQTPTSMLIRQALRLWRR
jgi:hypothetical protein